MGDSLLHINLFGACIVRSGEPGGFEITGLKHRALFALLATAPFGRRTRAFLQDTLWGTACYDTGRQSLRRALSDIKQVMGESFSQVLTSTHSDLTLDLSKVRFTGGPGQGGFLEGLDLREEGFNDWLRGMRLNPAQLDSLYSLRAQAPARPLVPIIAILPFRALGGDQDGAVIGDWLAEEVCRSLSRSNLLGVISHLSAREMARRWIDMQSIRESLKADFCLVGTIRPIADTLVLDADFIDTASGRIMWTRQFSGPRRSFIEDSSEGLSELVRAIGHAIADDAIAHTAQALLPEVADHKLLIAGVSLMHKPTLSEFARARELLETARERAPRAAEVHAWLGKWYVLSVFNGWSTNPPEDTRLAVDCAARALDIDPENAFCLTIDGFAHNNLLRRLDVAAARYDHALTRNPNEALSWLLRGALCAFKDEASEAIRSVDKARTLSPLDPLDYFYDSLSATAQLANENYEAALALAERSIAVNDRHLSTLRAKISALYHLGRREEARTAAAELLRRQPGFTVAGYIHDHPAAKFRIGRNMANALRGCGVP